jgi:bla regulator protein BlaR1
MSHFATNLVSAALLVALVLAVRQPIGRLFGPRAAFALWLVPAIRLVFPPIPAKFFPAGAGGSGGVDVALIIEPVARAAATGPDWVTIWAIGAALFLSYHLLSHHLFLRRALKDGRVFEAPGVLVDMVMTPHVDGPAATGLVHRLILLPQDFEMRFTPDQQRIALLHESLHHRRGDLWASAAALLAGASMWFSPLTYLALGAFRRDMESACDASVLAASAPGSAADYGETILRSAARPVPRSLCALTSLDELKGRLIMLNAKHGMWARIGGLGVVSVMSMAGVLLTAPARADEPKTEKKVEKRIIMHDGSGKGSSASWDSKDGDAIQTSCPGSLTVIEAGPAGTEQKKEKAKIVLCSKSNDKTEVAKGLENALANVEKDDDMDGAMKAEIVAKLKQEIAKAKAGG